MRTIIWFLAIVLLPVSVLASDIRGRWEGSDVQGNQHTLVFKDGHRVSWRVENAQGLDSTMEVEYKLDATASPHHFDLTGFDSGPLQGQALYGILEFLDDDTLRFDVDAGDPDGDPDELRPTEFTARTLTLKRAQ